MQAPRTIAIWCLILPGAVANGIFRQAVLLPALGTAAAFVLSGLMLAGWILVLATATVRWMGIHTSRGALGAGVIWLALTLGFEFGFGALVQGKSVPELLQAYAFHDGNIWPLVLLTTLLGPLLALQIRGAARD
ncbi:MAG: hypothetical protein QE290_06150 [Acidovorax sp.]|uniref:hypothetical protein n=1 Tax=Acidovorax sp. TaxID=1872122 RepID=UPI0026023A38|nr:hypothetical protein [Acidovorax sp.]MDH4463605.1 hypothetical protein [Acidovorax sp.]